MSNLTLSTFPFTTANPQHQQVATQCAELWNTAWGDEFALSSRVFVWLASQTSAQDALLLLAYEADTPVGFLLAHSQVNTKSAHLDALAIIPAAQNQGVEAALLAAAQSTFGLTASTTWGVGAGPLSLLLGVPEGSWLEATLAEQGFLFNETQSRGWIELAGYAPPQAIPEVAAAVYPAKPTDQTEILNFLSSLSTDRQERILHFVQTKRRLSDLMLLWTESGLAGICWLGFEDSPYPIELSFPYRLPRAWAQVGQLLLAPQLGDEYLAALLDAGLRRLHNNGVNSAVITAQWPSTLWEQFQIQPYQTFRSAILPSPV
ncbi:MAG: GNAT family N-acetyltransferase [Caldilineaceae bacterium]